VLENVKTLTATFSANYNLFVRAAEPDLPTDEVTLIGSRDRNGTYLTLPSDSESEEVASDPNGENRTQVTVKYNIVGYAKESNTSMVFFADRGDKIFIEDGSAWIERPRGHVYWIAFSSAHAASFTVAGVNATAAEAQAIAELRAVGRGATLLTPAAHGARRQLQGRKLFVDYGWCSTNAGFVLSSVSDLNFQDTANYCDPDQTCDSIIGCGTALSSCCIKHDECLQNEKVTRQYVMSKCDYTDCKPVDCDLALVACAWGVSCWKRWRCGWWWCTYFDTTCGSYSSMTALAMQVAKPNDYDASPYDTSQHPSCT